MKAATPGLSPGRGWVTQPPTSTAGSTHPQHTPTAPSLPLILLPSTRSTWPHVVLPAHSQHVLCSRQTLLLPTFLRLRFTPIPRTCAPLTLAEGWELMRLFSAVLGRIA